MYKGEIEVGPKLDTDIYGPALTRPMMGRPPALNAKLTFQLIAAEPRFSSHTQSFAS